MTAVLVAGRRAFSYLRWLPLIVAGMGQNVRGRADPPGGGRARPGDISAATYWRRRVFVLAVGIGLLTTVSWAATGMLAARPAADQAAHRGGTRAAGSAPAHVSRDRAPSKPSPRPASLPSPHRSTTRSHSAGRAVVCASGQVTLGLSSPQYWYQVGATPRSRCMLSPSRGGHAVSIWAPSSCRWSLPPVAGASGVRRTVGVAAGPT